jgi:hypothetical protein
MSNKELNSLDPQRSAAVGEMAASIQRGESRCFFIALVGYYIEGYPYPSSGLTVDTGGISNMLLTESGFQCQALFLPDQVRPEIVKANGTIQRTVADRVFDVVPVQVEVKFKDIWAVSEIIDGEQVDLYQNFEMMAPSMLRFMKEWEQWGFKPPDWPHT